LSPDTLRALTHCWADESANVRVLVAHLRDEINRAGHDAENALDIRAPDGQPVQTAAGRDLDVIRAHLADSDVAALIHDLAQVIARAERAAARPRPTADLAGLAADPPANAYGAEKNNSTAPTEKPKTTKKPSKTKQNEGEK